MKEITIHYMYVVIGKKMNAGYIKLKIPVKNQKLLNNIN